MADETKKDVDDAEEIKDPDDIGEESGDSEGEDAKAKKKKSGSGMMTILLAAGIPTVLILILAVVLFFTSFGRGLIGLDKGDAKHGEEESVEEAVVKLPEHITYYEMPELLVNIQTSSSKRKPYLRLAVKFEIHDPEAIKTLDLIKPRIIDAFQVYLRELRVDDLEGSTGSQRLKEELLKRVNTVAAPVKVIDVLFQVFVIQ
ncbi:MAG: flagellar basal body protein FliL [Alphaproteobacteria bacterium]|nr:flagellar basal body protein FliL [Alphaproteobacteria bacterium]NCQ67201.1 flagellar basal body protein FliL [Alphaproteobacteria bacterium]NCT07045.1 flagellar basal body protein FliL [Alphaproteobacteria bacterium]